MTTVSFTIQPGADLPTDPTLRASVEIARLMLAVADEMTGEYSGKLPEKQVLSCIFSGLTSAAANFANRNQFSDVAAEHLFTIAAHLRPQVHGMGAEMRCVQAFVDLVNALLRTHGIEEVVIGLLNAVANIGAVRCEHAEMARVMREFADMLTDPEKRKEAEAAAALATMPVDSPVQ